MSLQLIGLDFVKLYRGKNFLKIRSAPMVTECGFVGKVGIHFSGSLGRYTAAKTHYLQ